MIATRVGGADLSVARGRTLARRLHLSKGNVRERHRAFVIFGTPRHQQYPRKPVPVEDGRQWRHHQTVFEGSEWGGKLKQIRQRLVAVAAGVPPSGFDGNRSQQKGRQVPALALFGLRRGGRRRVSGGFFLYSVHGHW